MLRRRLESLASHLGRGGWRRARTALRSAAKQGEAPPFVVRDGVLEVVIASRNGTLTATVGDGIVADEKGFTTPRPDTRPSRPAEDEEPRSYVQVALSESERFHIERAASALGLPYWTVFIREAALSAASAALGEK